LRWMRQLGYVPKKNSINFAPKLITMESKTDKNTDLKELQKRIKELEQALEQSELKAYAYSVMVDLAEKEFNIPIKKKYGSKPLTKLNKTNLK
jgi:transposase